MASSCSRWRRCVGGAVLLVGFAVIAVAAPPASWRLRSSTSGVGGIWVGATREAGAAPASASGNRAAAVVTTPYVVLAYNDLGMHCMNADYEDIMILPPFNTLHAQVLKREENPSRIGSGVTVRYFIPNHTHAADVSNFWKYPVGLLGTPLPNVGVTGSKLAGTMSYVSSGDWAATGVPLIPTDDNGREDPYPLAVIEVIRNGAVVARTQAVMPVSTEMSCNTCHFLEGKSTAEAILTAHDSLHGTTLLAQRPVACANCHADNALGAPGQQGVPPLSIAMHSAHSSRVPQPDSAAACYYCHPGIRTDCQRDVHKANNIGCVECHGGMSAVGASSRRPWLDEPHCFDCHSRPNFEFERNGALFRNATGHGTVRCAACHGSPHAIGPTVTQRDNVQATSAQGHSGKIDTCTVCHTVQPDEAFWHRHDN